MRKFARFLGMAEYGADELILATICCGALAGALAYLVHPLLALVALPPWAIVVWFFRDPERAVPGDPKLLISPADGTVTDIVELATCPYVGAPVTRIGIFLSPLNVHVNRAPCEGFVEYTQFKSGDCLPAYNPKAPERNESMELGLKRPDGVKLLVKQITGILARRIICEARNGAVLRAGERYGMIKFGSRTELYVPVGFGFELKASIGQVVKGGESILAVRTQDLQPAGQGEASVQAGVSPEPVGSGTE